MIAGGLAGIGNGVLAAWMLARGHANGAALLHTEAGSEGAMLRNSFWAAALAVPAALCLALADAQASHSAHALARVLLNGAAGWAGFAVISHRFAGQVGRAGQWPRFMVAWNWCNLLQYMMGVAAVLPDLFGLPVVVGETAWLVALGWSIWLEWFATTVTLAIAGPLAAMLVLIDLLFGVAVQAAVSGLN